MTNFKRLHVACLAGMTFAPLLSAYADHGGAPQAASTRSSVVQSEAVPNWIWLGDPATNPQVLFRKTFDLKSVPASVRISASCDNHMVVTVNGKRVGVYGTWERVAARDIAAALVAGKNTIEVRARNEGGPAGLAARVQIGEDRVLVTDASWEATIPQRAVRGRWDKATVIGAVGDASLPWGTRLTPADFIEGGVEMHAGSAGEPQAVRPAVALHLKDGYVADLLYTVPNDLQGSWVAMANDPKGRIYVSDQGGKGLFRVTPAAVGDPDAVTVVEPVSVEVSGAQGMYWAFDSLYVNVNGQGLWRIQDTDGDDQLDAAENLIPLGYGGEHGPHAILPTRDGKGLYFIAGNHTNPPEFEGSQAPSNWGEDLLLPRQWDARGHARGKLAPGGWIARCDPDGKNIQIVSSGYRNQYDIAMNVEGEMFTYDADMEYDIGSPWYRPTRVCHVTSGSEFGWRSGTGKWPAYYEDSLPPVLDIGPGSPTGILFGTGAKFPAKYQSALFLLDWTFGTIYAVHLEPDGATFKATKEDFVWSKPLGVTDAVIGADGSLYFAVGGRGSQSALYRVRYEGDESVAAAAPPGVDAGLELRDQRRALEAFHGGVDSAAVDAAWPALASSDRFVRFAARIAIENQPVATWRGRALGETNTQATAVGLLALARQGNADDLAGLMAALGRLEIASLEESQALCVLRAYALGFTRLGAPDDGLRRQVIAKLDPLFPASSPGINTELARLLTFLGADTAVPKIMALMRDSAPEELPPWAELIQRNDTYGGPIAKTLANMPPVRNISFALILRNAKVGWTPELRKEYFSFFVDAAKHPGGASYAGFLENIRDEAADTLSIAEERTLSSLLGQSLLAPLPKNITAPDGPGREWTLTGATQAVGLELSGRSFARGRNLFHATSCSTCHRFDGSGGAIGPDLTTVANKFSIADILEAIVEPSKVISDQYGSHIVADHDGLIVEGILVEDGDEITVYPRDLDDGPTTFDRSEIKIMKESPTSQMPAGLIDALNEEELRDLVAFLVSGGNKKAAVFQKADQKKERR